MPLDNSPKLDLFKDGLPQKLPDASVRWQQQRILLTAVVVILSLLVGLQFIQSDQASLLAGVGAVKGVIVDEVNFQPVSADVFISGSDEVISTDLRGQFEIRNIPAGQHTLIVAYRNTGKTYAVEVPQGGTLDVGNLNAPTLARPYLDENYQE